MKRKPDGALTQLEAIAAVKLNPILYKVYIDSDLRKVKALHYDLNTNRIVTEKEDDTISLDLWFQTDHQLGYLFTNYFHAYAYSLKCKERVRDNNWRTP